MFGLNDSWIDAGKTASRLTVPQYRENLEQMLARLKAHGSKVVLMTPNPALRANLWPGTKRHAQAVCRSGSQPGCRTRTCR